MSTSADRDPLLLAEDDNLRSRHVRALLTRSASASLHQQFVDPEIPRVLVQFWHDVDRVPRDVQACIDSWGELDEAGFQRLFFHDRSARSFIRENFDPQYLAAFDRCQHPAMRCDYFRLCYILTHGGFYVDADDIYQGGDVTRLFYDSKLKVQPLCYDVSAKKMVALGAYLSGSSPKEELIYYVNNNPIIAPPRHPVLHLALERSTKMILGSSTRTDVQSTTGPGNLTASLVAYSLQCERAGEAAEFTMLTSWDDVAVSKWPLSYRGDERNWRIWTRRCAAQRGDW